MKKLIALLLTLILLSLPALADVPTIFDLLSGGGTEETQKTEEQIMNETIEALKAQVASLSAENQLLKIKENVNNFARQQLEKQTESLKQELESVRSENAAFADALAALQLKLTDTERAALYWKTSAEQKGALSAYKEAFQKWYESLYMALCAVRDAYFVDELTAWRNPVTGQVIDPLLPPDALEFVIPEMAHE